MPAKAKAAAPKHPKYIEMVKEAITATGKPVRGASRSAIVKYLEAKYGKVLGKNFKTALRSALKGAAAKGVLVQTKGSFRVSKAAKKVKVKKAKKPKKPKAKKVKKAKKPKAKKPKAKKAKKAAKPKKATKPKKAAKKPTKPTKATKPKVAKKASKAKKAAAPAAEAPKTE